MAARDALLVPLTLGFKSEAVFFRHEVVSSFLLLRHKIPRLGELLHHLSSTPIWMEFLHNAPLLQKLDSKFNRLTS